MSFLLLLGVLFLFAAEANHLMNWCGEGDDGVGRSICAEATILPPDPAKTPVFAILQKYNRVGLVVPEGAPHMWHAAMQSKSARLSALGEHYRRLASKGLI